MSIVWCYNLVGSDKTFHTLHPDKQSEVIGQALAYGSYIAEIVQREYAVHSAEADYRQLVRTFRASLRMSSKCILPGHLAEYDEAAQEIICFLPVIQQIEGRYTVNLQDYFNGYSLLWLSIVHELFHHLENTRFGKTDDLYRVEALLWGWVKRKACIHGLREIAANSFVKRYLNLSYYPAELLEDVTIMRVRSD